MVECLCFTVLLPHDVKKSKLFASSCFLCRSLWMRKSFIHLPRASSLSPNLTSLQVTATTTRLSAKRRRPGHEITHSKYPGADLVGLMMFVWVHPKHYRKSPPGHDCLCLKNFEAPLLVESLFCS